MSASPSPAQPPGSRIYGLDLVRASAIACVMIAHGCLIPLAFVPELDGWISLFSFYGVDIFFVLSGFLIGGILLRNHKDDLDTPIGLWRFWRRRWIRTLPNYYVFLLVNILVTPYFKTPVFDLSRYLVFLQNFAWRHPLMFAESWSLCVEEWFYFLLPICIFLLVRVARFGFKSAFLIASATFLVAPTVGRALAVSDAPGLEWDDELRKVVIYRLDAIMFGMLAAFARIEWPMLWKKLRLPLFYSGMGLLLINTAVFLTLDLDRSAYAKTMQFSMVSLTFAFMLPFFEQWRIQKETVLTTVVRKIALWSYSLYLCNYLVLCTVRLVRGNLRRGDWDEVILRSVIFVVASVAIAAMAYRYIERPMLLLRDQREKRWPAPAMSSR